MGLTIPAASRCIKGGCAHTFGHVLYVTANKMKVVKQLKSWTVIIKLQVQICMYVVLKGDARYLISNSKDQTIKLWDVRKFSPKEGLAASRLAVTQQNWDYRWQQVPQRGALLSLIILIDLLACLFIININFIHKHKAPVLTHFVGLQQ